MWPLDVFLQSRLRWASALTSTSEMTALQPELTFCGYISERSTHECMMMIHFHITKAHDNVVTIFFINCYLNGLPGLILRTQDLPSVLH